MSAGEKKNKKAKAHITKAVEYGTISLVCVSSCHWTAGPQRAVFHQRCDHRRLEAWPCLPQRSHSHTTKCSRYNQAAQPLFWFLLLLRKTHFAKTDTFTLVCKYSRLTQTCFEHDRMGHAYPRARTQITISLSLQSRAEREKGDSAIWRQFDGWTLRGTRLWLAWSCLEPLPVSAACQLHRVAECQLCHFIRN